MSLEGDAEATQQSIDARDGPAVLVGHSYGSAFITEVGIHPKVAALGLYLRIRAGQGRVGQHAHRGFRCRTQPPILPPGTASCSWSRTNPSIAHSRPARTLGHVHGRLAGPLGMDAPSKGSPPRLADQAQLVPGRHEDRTIPPTAQHVMAEADATLSEVAARLRRIPVDTTPIARPAP